MSLVMGCFAFLSGAAGDLFTIHPVLTFLAYSFFSYIIGFVLTKYWVFK
jgi:hypothetical protein